MSDQSLTTSTRGAIESTAGSGPGDPHWSGVSSGAEGVPPDGSAAAGARSSDHAKDSASMQDQAREQADRVIGTASQKAGSIADHASSTVDTGIERASTGLDSLADTIRGKSESLGGAQSAATAAAAKLESGAEMLRGQSSDQLVSELEALVRRKPVESMLVAAGVGFLLSKAMR